MKILFVIRHPMFLRLYSSTVRSLAERGHTIRLAFVNEYNKHGIDTNVFADEIVKEFPNVSADLIPLRGDLWQNLIIETRILTNYLRYLEPMFAKAPKLIERAESRIKMPFLLAKKLPAWARRCLGTCLEAIEKAIPSDPVIEEYYREFRPDVVLVTPYIEYTAAQIDYIKSARALGIPCAHCVASWDNLTSKGRILIQPDKVILWNPAQRQEAIELHGVPPENVAVTGAQVYDHWFDMKPSCSKEEFCRRVALDPSKPIILFVGSSGFISEQEVDFVQRWMGAIRNSQHETIRTAGILMRPHPTNAAQWQNADVSAHGNVAVWPRSGAVPIQEDAKQNYFDTLYHASVVVGINTSAFIEAGVVGRACHSLANDDFADTQEGTLHFAHLTKSGFLRMARSMEEHCQWLDDEISGRTNSREINAQFVASFVRPNGVDKPATPQIVDVIEKLASRGTVPKAVMPAWAPLLRFLLIGPTYLAKRRSASIQARRRKKKKLAKEPGEKAARRERKLAIKNGQPDSKPAKTGSNAA